MGAKDTKSKEYMANNERFADLCNYALYKGIKVIQPGQLVECDSTDVLSIIVAEGEEELVQRWRDLLKQAVIKSSGNVIYILVGIENQAEIHYAMPVRAMLYDALSYCTQARDIAVRHRKNRDKMKQAEFLSGFQKTDKLIPVITITLYWGTDRWDGPIHLYDMFENLGAEVEKFVSNYQLNLVAPYLIEEEEFAQFRTSLGSVLKFLKYARDKKMLGQKVHTDPAYKGLDNESVTMINLFAGMNIALEEGKEVTDVCQAFEEIKQEYAEEYAKEYAKQTLAAECVKTVENVMKNLSLTLEEGCKALGYTVETYLDAKEKLKVNG